WIKKAEFDLGGIGGEQREIHPFILHGGA
ncbi:MAG: hypothetical protein JWO08_3208, partial [Verrucomicrobiaceae bacterium]|nr:hypothetical protein [Verrucomicrobiaceae bacterium]